MTVGHWTHGLEGGATARQQKIYTVGAIAGLKIECAGGGARRAVTVFFSAEGCGSVCVAILCVRVGRVEGAGGGREGGRGERERGKGALTLVLRVGFSSLVFRLCVFMSMDVYVCVCVCHLHCIVMYFRGVRKREGEQIKRASVSEDFNLLSLSLSLSSLSSLLLRSLSDSQSRFLLRVTSKQWKDCRRTRTSRPPGKR